MIKNLENYYSEDKENYNILNMIYTIILWQAYDLYDTHTLELDRQFI